MAMPAKASGQKPHGGNAAAVSRPPAITQKMTTIAAGTSIKSMPRQTGVSIITRDAGNNTTGITLNLGVVQLKAGALSAQCTADSAGNVQGSAQLASAKIVTPGVPPFIPEITLLNLPLNPPPNFGIVSGVLNLVLNKQVINADGSITVTALEITGIGTGIEIGKVTCGPNLVVVDGPLVPGLPVEGTAVAAGVLAIAAGAAGTRRLRNRQPVAA